MKWLPLLALLLVTPAWAAPFDAFAEAGIDRLPDAHLPADAVLTDEAGRAVRLGDVLGGPPLLFAAVAYDCPNLCGLTLDGLFAGLAGAGLTAGRDYRVVVVGIDPHEGPPQAAALKAELNRRRPLDATAVRFLTGPADAVTQAMGVRAGWDAEHGQYAHISAVAVLTPEGRLSRWLMGIAFDPRSLRLGLVEASQGKVGTLGDQVLLLCYGFDPVHGRYGWAVRPMVLVIAAMTAAGVGCILWRALP